MSRWILAGRLTAVALLAASAATLAGCGKRGVLDVPPPLFGDRAKARYEASQQQQAQDAADARARTGASSAAADQSDDGPKTTRDVKAPEQLLTPASRDPIVGAPSDPRGPPVNPTPP
jgi:predicted small lipoprotein YifL